jgi:hypothetical protein
VIQHFAALNKGKKYVDQIKPFKFMLTCHVHLMGHHTGVNPERFHLVNPRCFQPFLRVRFIRRDQYSGTQYMITTEGDYGGRRSARVKTYDDVAGEYAYHSESKCGDADGNTCGKRTEGLLQRRHVYIDSIKYIGKESNSLEEVNEGLIQAEQNVYTEYPDPRRDEWQVKILPALKKAPIVPNYRNGDVEAGPGGSVGGAQQTASQQSGAACGDSQGAWFSGGINNEFGYEARCLDCGRKGTA